MNDYLWSICSMLANLKSPLKPHNNHIAYIRNVFACRGKTMRSHECLKIYVITQNEKLSNKNAYLNAIGVKATAMWRHCKLLSNRKKKSVWRHSNDRTNDNAWQRASGRGRTTTTEKWRNSAHPQIQMQTIKFLSVALNLLVRSNFNISREMIRFGVHDRICVNVAI